MLEFLAARYQTTIDNIEETMTVEELNLRYVLAKKDKHRELEALSMMLAGVLLGGSKP